MKLENQVVSLELSKKLKELGVPQKSLFWWGDTIGEPRWQILIPEKMPRGVAYENARMAAKYSAHTVAEIGELFPVKVEDVYREIVTSHQGTGGWICAVKNIVSGKYTEREEADTEANARAKMLIYLIENKLTSLT